ncbi:MAG: flagellar assembly peptidoglycan hydrolase FlgJ [Porticoccaceae bacterium]|nr:flagellar assembly peptidoglycan hydrolase FlgJ [Porticoccaceae bacterium]
METQSSYHDFSGFSQLRAQARQDAPGATGEVASQFESILIQIMLKSMRDTVPEGGLFDSSQMTMYQEMFDQQVALDMSHRGGIGLAPFIEQQLGTGTRVDQGNNAGLSSDEDGEGADSMMESVMASIQRPTHNPFVSPNLHALNTAPRETGSINIDKQTAIDFSARRVDTQWRPADKADFVSGVHEHAARAATELGVSKHLLIAQAALETGWGQKLIKHGDGASSFNLFGIKASHDWPGEKVTKFTLEYKDGVAKKESARFRSYASIGESFDDYVAFLRSNPRYADALARAGSDEHYARSLQAAGYATDPHYANKILDITQQLKLEQTAFALKDSHETPLL